jgi:hypothetical protein
LNDEVRPLPPSLLFFLFLFPSFLSLLFLKTSTIESQKSNLSFLLSLLMHQGLYRFSFPPPPRGIAAEVEGDGVLRLQKRYEAFLLSPITQ